jgi:hypothetical protein
LQRTALNLDGNQVIFGFGGNNGDCSDYRGTVVAAPVNGDPPRFWQYQPAAPSSSGGAVWAPAGPAVDSAGYVYATTGNPNPPAGQTASTFDYSDSVLKLDPTQDFVADPATEPASPLGWFEPPNWEEESNNDLDLSSAGAELLPGGLLFQAGKDGVGYLIDEATMGSGAAALYHQQVCAGHGSFGGDAFANGVIYIPCVNGTQALQYNQAAQTFTPLWQGPADAFGPPIVSAGLVWTIATGGFSGGGATLYGLDPATGTPRYTETLPSPVTDHFASPSAAGGRLFVSTGSSVTAYRVAEIEPGEKPPGEEPIKEPKEPIKEPSKEPAPEGPKASAQDRSTGTTPTVGSPVVSTPTAPLLLRTHLHASPKGHVRMALRCAAGSKSCKGTIALQARFVLAAKRTHRHSRMILIKLAQARFGPTHGDFGLTLHLDRGAMAHLHRHKDRLTVQVTISSPGAPARTVTGVLT